MSQTITTISEIHYGCPGTAIQVRILRMWTPQIRSQETWFLAVDKNVQCPNCKIATFKQWENWFCPSDDILSSPTTTFKLSAIITDEIQSMTIVLSDNATQDLFGTTSDKLISHDNINHRKILPPIASALQGIPKKMKLRMTNTSTDNNIRFIITDIDKSPSEEKIPIRTPPTQQSTSSKHNEKESTSIPQQGRLNVRRSLPFESQDTATTKRKTARKTY
ncbi:unnamed protein product [Lactuca virosa]|uniref:Replication factor A C-terminal domain-containing protein n=1 Tax=Lactuca virosa TaxID=75947 RepID=A0AAU9MAW2_9ASTR|nr:unnamed protein product [Lactuca virosa]